MGTRRETFALFSHGIFACFLPNQDPDSSLACFAEINWRKMVVTWREHEHEEEDMVVLHDPIMVTTLQNCGLFKFFHISSMRQQINLLQYFLDAWDPTNQVFQIGGKSIPLTVMDIYFLTGLSRHGAPLSLSGSAHGGESVRDYIRRYCREGSQSSTDGKINIRDVTDRPMRTILFTFARLASSVALHLANRSYMQYSIECLEPKVFNWCEAILLVIKEQLSKVNNGRSKNFGYGSILTNFSLERIPLMQPQNISLGLPAPREPRMQRWVDLMARHVGQLQISFSDAFFEWFDHHEMIFVEYPYVGMDFQGTRIWRYQLASSGVL